MSAHYVYRCFDSDGRLLYVGCTSNLAGRLAAHRANSWWAPMVTKVRAEVWPDRITAGVAERHAISTEHPRFNILSRWRSRYEWTADMWRDYITALENSPNAQHSNACRRHITRARHQFSAQFGGAA